MKRAVAVQAWPGTLCQAELGCATIARRWLRTGRVVCCFPESFFCKKCGGISICLLGKGQGNVRQKNGIIPLLNIPLP